MVETSITGTRVGRCRLWEGTATRGGTIILACLQRSGPCLLVLSMLVSTAPAHAAERGAATGQPNAFRLLRLESQLARWRTDGKTPVIVRYAFIDRETQFPGARNCTGMQSLSHLAAHNGITHAQLAREMAYAARTWESVAKIRFVEVEDASVAHLLIGAQTNPVGRAFTNVELTAPQEGKARWIARSLICLNPVKRWKIGFDGNLDVYDLRYTLTHEIGHAIGLDHPSGKGQLMGYHYNEAFDGLQSGDIAGVVTLYGTPSHDARVAARTMLGESISTAKQTGGNSGNPASMGLGATISNE